MVGTRVSNAKGVNTSKNSSGLSAERDSQNKGFYPWQVDSTQTFTSNTTLVAGDAGVNIISASNASLLTMSLPSASACPGAMFLFVAGNAAGHVLTGSHSNAFVLTGTFGTKLTFGSTTNSSVALQSNGVSFMVLNWSVACNVTA